MEKLRQWLFEYICITRLFDIHTKTKILKKIKKNA